MEPLIHDDESEVLSVADTIDTESSEANLEPDNESEVFQISCGFFFFVPVRRNHRM